MLKNLFKSKRYKRLEEENLELRKSLGKKSREIDLLNSELNVKTKENSNMKESISNLEHEIEQLNLVINNYKTTANNKLTKEIESKREWRNGYYGEKK